MDNIEHAVEHNVDDEAISAYKKSLDIDPLQPETVNNAFAILYNAERYEEALEFCDAFLERSYGITIITLLDSKHHVLKKLNRDAEAEQIKIQVINLLTENAIELIQQGLFGEALNDIENVLKRDPKNTQVVLLKAVAMGGLEKYDESRGLFKHYLTINPDDSTGWRNYASCLAMCNRLDESLDAYNKAIALAPSFAEAYGGKGSTLENMSRYEEALEAYDQTIERNPRYLMALICKVRVLSILNRYEEALNICDGLLAMERYSHIRPDIEQAREEIIHHLKNNAE